MTGMAQGARSGPRDRMVFALILIIVGLGGLASQLLDTNPSVGGWVVMIIGLGFLGAFTYTRQYGFLVPGGIMTGLGAGIVASESIAMSGEQTGGTVVLGLGLGFVSIWLIGALARVTEHHAWPLVPGTILSIVGVALLIGGQAVDLLDYWGVAVVALGILLLVRSVRESRRTT